MPKQAVLPVPIYGKQAEFLKATEWLRGFVGGRGTGKTWVGSYAIATQARAGEPWMCISPDAGVVHETTYPTFCEVIKELGLLKRQVLSPYPRVYFYTLDGGTASLVFRSAEKPGKLRGPSKAGIWIDEASVQAGEVFDVAAATLRHKGKMGPCLMTFTPRGRTHWTFDKFFQPIDEPEAIEGNTEMIGGRWYRHRPNTALVRAHTADNPFLPESFHDVLASQYSSQFAQQELAGEFIDVSGLMFRREWFRLVDEAPRDCMRVRYWDKAATPGSGSYTAGVLIARDNLGQFYVEDVVRGQWSPHERDTVIEQTAERDSRKYRGEVIIVTEQEGGSGGKEIAHQMVTRMAGYPVFRDVVGGKQSRNKDGVTLPGEGKITRALGIAAQAEAGNVFLVRGDWNADYLDELTAFPESSVADQVDASSGAFNKLTGKLWATTEAPSKERVGGGTDRFGAAATLSRVRQRRLMGMKGKTH